MCGFASIFSSNFDESNIRSVMDEMLDSLDHRGPDGKGVHYIPDQALFGHKRLAIIDLSHGAQPMCSMDGRYTLIFNGEIYNYLEIKKALIARGIVFESNSDSEVLLYLLIEKREKALAELNGMFSFVFHDKIDNSWIAARDHFGIKPLYFALTKNELIFASEIKTILLHPQIKAERDLKGLGQYLAFQFCLNEKTLFKGIEKVRPGHFLKGYGAKIVSETKYWSPEYNVDYTHSESWFQEKLLDLIKDSVRMQIRADVPLGTYLSGGIDSSLVSSLASTELGRSVPMFHGKFLEGPDYDESFYAKSLADYCDGLYYEIIPSASDFVNQLSNIIFALDEPLAGPGVFPQFATSQLASQHVKVILGGQGGDEIFGGYARYLVGYLEQALKGAIMGTQEEGNHLVTLESIVPNLSILKKYVPMLGSFWKNNLFDDMDRRYFQLIDRSQGIGHLINREFFDRDKNVELFDQFRSIFNQPETNSYINKMTHFDQQTLLPALLQVEDRVSMASSIESRVPILDRRIVDLVATMPPPMKFQGGRTKDILKKSIKNLVPEAILKRSDKMGFPVPLKEWMQAGEVRDFVGDTLLSKASIERGIYKKKALVQMMGDQGLGSRQLWGALNLELWHKRFIDAN